MKTREILLYKRKIDDINYCLEEPGFLCFSDYDGMDIKTITTGSDFTNLWDKHVANRHHTPVDHLSQSQRFLLYKENDSDGDVFFDDDNVNVLTVSFLSIKKNPAVTWLDVIAELEHFTPTNKLKPIETRAYFTLGSSDIVLFIKASKFDYCANAVGELRFKQQMNFQINFSYSIVALPSKMLTLDDTTLKGRYGETIKKITLSVSEKIFGVQPNQKSNDLIEALKEQIEGMHPIDTTILGNYDVQLSVRNVKFYNLIRLYKQGNILHHKEYSNMAFNCATRLHGDNYEFPLSVEQSPLSSSTICTNSDLNDLNDSLNSIKTFLSNAQTTDQTMLEIGNTLYTILISLIQAEQTPSIRSHINDILYRQVNMFTERFIHYKERIHRNDYKQIDNFLKNIIITMQSVNYANLHLFQSQSLNVSVYNMPIKLTKFYAKFVSEYKAFVDDIEAFFCDRYNKTKKGYNFEFFLFSELTAQIQTAELFRATKYSLSNDPFAPCLVLTTVAAKEFFSNTFLFVLAHELSHQVGHSIRRRNARNKLWETFLIEDGVEHLIKALSREIIGAAAKEELKKDVKVALKQVLNETTVDKPTNEELSTNYESYINDKFLRAINAKQKTILAPIHNYFAKTISSMRNHELPAEYVRYDGAPMPAGTDRDEAIEKIMTDIDYELEYLIHRWTTSNAPGVNKRFNAKYIQTILDRSGTFLHLSQEIFADLLAILVLQCSIEDYIKLFYASALEKRFDLVDIRLLVVIRTLITKDDYMNQWHDLYTRFSIPMYTCVPYTGKQEASNQPNFKKLIAQILKKPELATPGDFATRPLEQYLCEYAKACMSFYDDMTSQMSINGHQKKVLQKYNALKSARTNIIDVVMRLS